MSLSLAMIGKGRISVWTSGSPMTQQQESNAGDMTDGCTLSMRLGAIGLELDDTAKFMDDTHSRILSACGQADSARPESISYLKRQDPRKERPYIPLIESVKKWP